MSRRAQGIVETIVLAPLLAAAVGAFAIGAQRLVAQARAEAVLATAQAADAADEPLRGGGADGIRVRWLARRIVVTVPAPLGSIRLQADRMRG